MTGEPLVLGFGGVAADLLCEVSALPSSDGVTYIRSYAREAGGMIGTSLSAIARLGGRCAYAGSIGTDPEGEQVVESLRRFGVDLSRLHRGDAGSTPFSIVLVEPAGERAIVHHRGARNLDELPGPLPSLEGVDHLHIDCSWLGTALPLARAAANRSIPISIDVSQNQRDSRLTELMPLVTYAVVNAPFARTYTGSHRLAEAAQAIRRMGARVAVITNGENPGWCVGADGNAFPFEPFSAETVVDTTGAGDAFHGAFVYALLHGYDLPGTVRFASVAATINCRALGGQSGLPSRDEVEALL